MTTITVMRRETIKVEVDAVTAERAWALADQGWMPVEVVHGDRAYWIFPSLGAMRSETYYLHLNTANRRSALYHIINRAHEWAEREGLLETEGEG